VSVERVTGQTPIDAVMSICEQAAKATVHCESLWSRRGNRPRMWARRTTTRTGCN